MIHWDPNWDTWYKPEQALNVWSVFSNLRKGSVNVQIWDVFIWHHWFCWVFSSQSNPPGSPFTPKSSWALTLAALALKAELFSAAAPGDPPLVPPTSTIPFSCRDNFIHPVHHCIQLNAETMPTLEWIELACVHVLTKAKKGRCDVFIFPILTSWSLSSMSRSTPFTLIRYSESLLQSFSTKVTFLSTYMQMIQEYFFKCRLGFGDVQLGQLSLFSPASHRNSAQTTLLFSHHSYSSQGLLTSLLISLHVLWFRQYVFTVWAKKCRGHHTSWRQTCETRLGLSLWVWALLLCRSAWSWISLRPNNAFSGIYE